MCHLAKHNHCYVHWKCQISTKNFSPNWQNAPPHINVSAKKILSRLATSQVFYIIHLPSHANELIAYIGWYHVHMRCSVYTWQLGKRTRQHWHLASGRLSGLHSPLIVWSHRWQWGANCFILALLHSGTGTFSSSTELSDVLEFESWSMRVRGSIFTNPTSSSFSDGVSMLLIPELGFC